MELDSKVVVAELTRIFEADGEIDPEVGDPKASMPPDAIKQSGNLHPSVVKHLKKLHTMQNDIVDGKSDDYQGLHKHVVNTMSLAKKHGHHDIVGDLDSIKKVALKHDAIKRKGTAKPALASPDEPEKSASPAAPPAPPSKAEPEAPEGDSDDSKLDLDVAPASHKSVQSVDPKAKLKANPKYDWGSDAEVKPTSPPPDKAQSDAEDGKLKALQRAQDPESSKIDKTVDTMRNAFANDSNYQNSRSGSKYNPAHDKAAIQKAAPAMQAGDHGRVKTTSKKGYDAKILSTGEKPQAPPVPPPLDPRKMPLPKNKVSPTAPKV